MKPPSPSYTALSSSITDLVYNPSAQRETERASGRERGRIRDSFIYSPLQSHIKKANIFDDKNERNVTSKRAPKPTTLLTSRRARLEQSRLEETGALKKVHFKYTKPPRFNQLLSAFSLKKNQLRRTPELTLHPSQFAVIANRLAEN